MTTIRTATFNPWIGQSARDLERNLNSLVGDLKYPHVLDLQEVWDVNWDRVVPAGYDVVTPEGGHREDRGSALLIRPDVEIIRTGEVDTAYYGSPGWRWGPKGQPKTVKHPARVFPWATIRHDDVTLRVIGVHRSPAGFTFNRDAYTAEDAALCAWFDRRWKLPSLALADWNCHWLDPRRNSVRSLARRVDGGLAVKGIDGGVVRGIDVAKVRKLRKKYGSDGHRPVAINLREKR